MATIWAVNYSVVKYGAEQLEPLAYNATRTGLAAVALLALVLRPGAPPVSPGDRRALLRLGLLGHGVYQVLFISGVHLTRAGNAALVAAANPALTALVAALLGAERLRARTAAGIALAFAGIGALMWGSASARPQAAPGSTLGDALVFLASLSWALYAVLMKPQADRVDAVQVTAWSLVGGFPLLLALGAPALLRTHWSQVTPLTWGAVAYGGLAAMVLAMLFWSHGMRVLGPTRTALFGQLQPVIAVLFAWVALGEVPTVWQGVGAVLVLAGLVLARRS
jgi:drug/metabolite transporter (DMT)-like permease